MIIEQNTLLVKAYVIYPGGGGGLDRLSMRYMGYVMFLNVTESSKCGAIAFTGVSAKNVTS